MCCDRVICLRLESVNSVAFIDNDRHCISSLSVRLHMYAKNECQIVWHNGNFLWREITLIANDSLYIILHILSYNSIKKLHARTTK